MNNKMLLPALMLFVTTAAIAQTLQPNQWIADGPINAMAAAGDTVYLAGTFEYVGPLTTKNGAALNLTTGAANPAFPSIEGTVNAVISDHAGGWYIGGDFSTIGLQARSNLARINADGSVNAWNPGADMAVHALALYGSKIYVGGEFGLIGGLTFNFLAAVDTATGAADPSWDPEPDDIVTALAVSPQYVLAAGAFYNVGVTADTLIAKIDRSSGNADNTFPSMQSTAAVYVLALSGDSLYIGGDFSTVGTVAVTDLAAIDLATDSVTSWAPGPNGAVRALLVHGESLYAGGDFYQFTDGESRLWCSEFSLVDGSLTSWSPQGFNDFSGSTVSITFANGTVYVGGTIFANEPGISHLAAFDSSTGDLTGWYPGVPMNFYYYDPTMQSTINSIAASGNQVYAGGKFNSIGGKRRRLLAAVNAATGAVLDWRPGPFGGVPAVYTLAVQGNSVYVGGDFTQLKDLNGTTYDKRNLAVLDRVTGDPNAWSTETNRAVRKLTMSGNTLYVAGDFDTIGTFRRYGLAAVNATTGNVLAWAPSTGDTVISDIAVSGNTVYIGGHFTTFGGASRSNLAAVDATTGVVMTWAPNPDAPVYSLLASGGTLYVGGSFGHITGQPRNSLASFAIAGGTLNSWDPNVTSVFAETTTPGWVYALCMQPSALYVGGIFYKVGGISRSFLASVDPGTASVSPFSNTFGNWNNYVSINSFTAANSALLIGGEFDTLNSSLRPNLISFITNPLPIQLASCRVKVLLEGPFNTSTNLMEKSLNAGGILSSHFTGASIPSDAVDSINIEIRNDTTSAASVRKFHPAWLQTDGSIKDFFDTTKNYVEFDTLAGNYYIIVRHRNHLAIMSATPQALSSTSTVYDFTTGQDKAHGTNPMKLIGTKYCMYAGDANASGIVTTSDANGVFGALLASGYNPNDINLSSVVSTADANIIFTNLLIGSQVTGGVHNGGEIDPAVSKQATVPRKAR